MSKWTSYSYINLAAKGFDCLSYLACCMRVINTWYVEIRGSTSSGYTARTSFNILLTLVPVAEVKQGVYIRGDMLTFGNTSPGGVVGTSIRSFPSLTSYYPDYNGSRPGSYVIHLWNNKQSTDPQYLNDYLVAGGTCQKVYRQGSNARQLSALYWGETYQTGLGVPVPFTWDSTTGEAKLSLEIPIQEFVNFIKSRFETEFHGNELNLDTSQTLPNIELEMNCPAASYAQYYYNAQQQIVDSGDPITAPLFTIPFARS